MDMHDIVYVDGLWKLYTGRSTQEHGQEALQDRRRSQVLHVY